MTFAFTPAKRENVPLLIGVAGGTGSGKTMSALRTAKGMAAGHPFAAIDTENGRMSHYADLFPELRVAELRPPFRPERYAEAIDAAVAYLEAEGIPPASRVVVVDSMSHEWAGDGGCLDWKDELSGGDDKRSAAAWAKVKPAHKRMVTHLLGIPCHVLLAFRAEPKIDIVRKDGRVEFVPKKTLPGGSLDGWLPITEKMLPYELTASFMLMADNPGVPLPLKLQEQHKPFVPLDQPLSEETGRALAAWARGEAGAAEALTSPADDRAQRPSPRVSAPDITSQRDQLVDLLMRIGADIPHEQIAAKVAAGDAGWFVKQITRAEERLGAAA